jgi:quercetin dioxygenase-like cupin family protein
MSEARWLIDGYDEWLQDEGLPVTSGLAVDLLRVQTAPWKRLGAGAAIVHVDARGDFTNLLLYELAAGGTSKPMRHLFEAVVYVLEGEGRTVFESSRGTRSIEWHRGSVFAIPLNLQHRHHAIEGTSAARLALVTNLPLVMKLFRDPEFVFGADHEFDGRIGPDEYFLGVGTFIPVKEHRHIWETNHVPDAFTFSELRDSPSRGRGSANIQFMLADGTLHSHMSEIPPGEYKKAHRHDGGTHIIQLSGTGYSLYWFEGQEPTYVEWAYGMLHSPQEGIWHQHFNTGDSPARYVAASMGSIRYPFTAAKTQTWGAERREDQIEYEDEDPEIRRRFEASRARTSLRAPG